jgi:hypothetical protein
LLELALIVCIRNAEGLDLEGEIGGLTLEGLRFAIRDGQAFGQRFDGRAEQNDLFLQRSSSLSCAREWAR